MIILIKFMTFIIAGTVLSKTYMDFKKKKETITMFLFWTITWLLVISFTLLPDFYIRVENYFVNLGIGSRTFIGLIFIFLLFMVYRVYVKAHRLERQLRDLVMKIGLREVNE